MTALLDIKDMRVYFAGFSPVRGVTMDVKRGEIVALVGNSGSGKSSLAMALMRLQDGVRVTGSVVLDDQELVDLPEEEMIKLRGKKFAMIFQEPMTSLNPLHKVGDQVLESLELHTDKATKKRVYELLRLVELNDVERIYESYPHMLSGGQRQRIMIAMALAGDPDLLIADEPTTALDVTVQKQILSLLKSIQKKLGLSILFITHDLNLVKVFADRVYVMKFGKIIATRVPEKEKVKSRKPFVVSGKPVLGVNHVSVHYGDFEAVKDVSFNLYPMQSMGIVGESGSGKSSLAQGLIRLVSAEGFVTLFGEDFYAKNGVDLRQARAQIQMVFQDPASSLNPRMMVEDIVGEGLKIHQPKLKKNDRQKKVLATLKSVGLKDEVMMRYPHELSGGQRARVLLARALILEPKILILDEMTSALDIYTQRNILDLLTELQGKLGLSYIFISHDMDIVRQMCDYMIVMKDGEVVEQGMVGHVLSHPQNPYTQELLAASLT